MNAPRVLPKLEREPLRVGRQELARNADCDNLVVRDQIGGAKKPFVFIENVKSKIVHRVHRD